MGAPMEFDPLTVGRLAEPLHGGRKGVHYVGAWKDDGLLFSPYLETSEAAHAAKASLPDVLQALCCCYHIPTDEEQREYDRRRAEANARDVEIYTVVKSRTLSDGAVIHNYAISIDFLDRDTARRALAEIQASEPEAKLCKSTLYFSGDRLRERSELLRSIYRQHWRPVQTPWTRPLKDAGAVRDRQARQMRDPRVPRKRMRKEKTRISVLDMKNRLGLGFGAMFSPPSRKARPTCA